jgi:hypothetical protein
MGLQKRGKYYYGDCQADIRGELLRYSKVNEYEANHFADAVCKCGGTLFRLLLDDTRGVAVRICTACSDEHAICDSDDYLADAELEECACACGHEEFEITVGVALYEGTEDVRWLYVGCRCTKCGLTAPYGDWKNEFIGFRDLLARV